MSQRSYLIFECLDKNRGNYVTRRELEQYLIDQKAAFKRKNVVEINVRSPISELRHKLGLANSIVNHKDKKRGWRLLQISQ